MVVPLPPRGARPTVLLYDWDNTLVDGWAAITAALNVVFAEFAMPPWTVDDAKIRVRVALHESFPLMFGARWEHARDLFNASFHGRHLDHLRPMPGAAEALAASAAWPLGVVPGCSTAIDVTSRPRLGSIRSDCPLSVLPTVAFIVCSSAPAAAVTSTVVAVEPTFRIALIVNATPMLTCWLLTLYDAKPCLANVML